MIKLDVLRDIVCIECDVTMYVLMRVRKTKAVDARKIFVLLAMDVMGCREYEVTEYFGCDHSTVSHYRASGRELLVSDTSFSETYDRLKTCIAGDVDWGNMPYAVAILKMEMLKAELSRKMREVDEVIKQLRSKT